VWHASRNALFTVSRRYRAARTNSCILSAIAA
jgi:hypothetical protein